MSREIDTLYQMRLEFEAAKAVAVPEWGSQTALDIGFPIAEANALATQESFNKHLFRPNTYLHKWWARRSGTTFRYLLKGLCTDAAVQDYYAAGGLQGKIILDPMMGGGTIIHEAIRLGASVIGVDIDPIPFVQARASLTRFPLQEKREVFDRFFGNVAGHLASFFVTACPDCGTDCESQFVLYGQRRRCGCGEVLFVNSLRLREESDGRVVQLSPYTGAPYWDSPPFHAGDKRRLIYEKGDHTCSICHESFVEIRSEPFSDRYRPLVVAGYCPRHKQFFKAVDTEDQRKLAEAKVFCEQHIELPIDELRVPVGPKSNDLLARGITHFSQLFSPRQQIYLAACRDALDGVEEAHRLWLSLLVSTSLEFNCMLCGYKGGDSRRPGAIRHVFSHHAYSFPYTALENNPVFSRQTSGTLKSLFQDRIVAATQWAKAPIERRPVNGHWIKEAVVGEYDGGQPVGTFAELKAGPQAFWVLQRDASSLPIPDNTIDHVVTDPPYYDSVQYSDLAHFFRAWLQWFLPDRAGWRYEVTDSAVAETARDGAKYQRVLSAIWQECYRVLKKPSGRLVFTFHHWRPAAWAHLALALKHSRFELVTSYTIHSENPISVHIRQLNALKHDSVLVLQPKVGKATQLRYSVVEQVDTGDSYAFCSDCARLLGYCLETELDDEDVFALWRHALRGSE